MTTNISTPANRTFLLPLWPDGAPGSEDWHHSEQDKAIV